MASYNELLALIDAYINRNGVQAITGQILNGVLKAMVDQLGRGYTLMGYAEPTGDPGTPDGPESWFASVPGTYTNYGEIQVAAGELALLSFAPSEGWTKNTIYEGFREVTATADDNIGFPQVGVTYANGVLSFDFKNIKGEPGENGDPAGFGAVTASVDDQVGTPSVSVSSSGPDTAKNFAFAFHNLKGETGVTSVVATVDNTSGNPQCSVSLQGGQLTLAFTGLKGAQGNTGSSVDYPFTIVNNLTTDDPTQALSAAMGVELDGKVSQLEAKVTDIVEPLKPTDDPNSLYVVDANGYVIAKIDNNGIHSVEMEAQGKKLSLSTNEIIDELYKDSFIIADGDGNAIIRIDKNGLKTIAIDEPGHIRNSWLGKRLATYGDSITAICNGNFQRPYADASLAKWANRVADFFSFSHQYGRGIGSTTYKYILPHGGQVAWCKTDTGEFVGRDDTSNYDDYSGTIPAGCSTCRGSGSSWLRIKTMFPASIKDTIGAVLVQFHNDFHQDMETEVSWIPNDTTDPEWNADTEHYSVLGGDYNIGTSVKGGIASVVMKLQSWMPNAVIVLMTPISGVYDSAGVVDGNFDNTEAQKMQKLAECVKDVAFRMSIPCIDVYGTDRINTLNRTEYISDTIHPYTEEGNKMVARAIIGGLMGIVANI